MSLSYLRSLLGAAVAASFLAVPALSDEFISFPSRFTCRGPLAESCDDFINSPSRYLYRFSGFYNGYARQPNRLLYESYVEFLDSEQSRRLCKDMAREHYSLLVDDILSIGQTNDRRVDLLIGCEENYLLTGSGYGFEADLASISTDVWNFNFVDDVAQLPEYSGYINFPQFSGDDFDVFIP